MKAETVAGLEQIIGKLETKHAELIKRNTELTTVRASVAYKALSEDDAKARATLDRVNRDSIEHSAELASVEAALATARGKLAAAEQREANIVRLEQAQAIRREWAEVGVDFDTVDKHLAAAVEAFGNIYGRYDRMQQLGFKPPPQKELMLCDVVVGYLMALPQGLWRQLNHQGLDHLPPNRRRTANSLYQGSWDPQVERQAEAIAGEPSTTNQPEAA